MKVLLFGATGMVGQGVLLECLRDERVEQVLAVGRTPVGRQHAKLREVVRPDLSDLSPDDLAGYDACFFCVGVSAAGMREADYRRITYDLTLAVVRQLSDLTFVYVSGQGTDSSEHGRMMWARVKGATENALLALPLRSFMFRPGFIQPMHGVRSKTRLYAAIYRASGPLFPMLRRLFPRHFTTTEVMGRAMIEVAAHGTPKRVLETPDINKIGATG
ncbi:MAG TPA: epimerase [Pseudonocardiaceae bacterium]|nr:epimerase [Pseudonocardiaceae bacterium]